MCVYLYIHTKYTQYTHICKETLYFGCEYTSNYLIKSEKQNDFDDHTCFNDKHLCYEYINSNITK